MIFGGLEMPNYSINALCWRFGVFNGLEITIFLLGPTGGGGARGADGTWQRGGVTHDTAHRDMHRTGVSGLEARPRGVPRLAFCQTPAQKFLAMETKRDNRYGQQ